MSLSLFFSNLKLGRWGLLAWVILIVLYGILTMYLYPTVTDSTTDILGYLNSLPDALKAAFGYEGIDFSSVSFIPDGFATLEFLVLWPLLIGIYGVFASVGIAREAERGTLDLLMAQPVKRSRVLVSKFSVFVFAAVLIAAGSLLGLWLGSFLIDETVNMSALSLALFEAFLLVLAIAAVTLLCSVVFLEPRKALTVAGIFVGGAYILNFMVPVLDPSWEWMRNLSLFYFYQPNEVVTNVALNGTAIAVYIAMAVVSFTAALFIFRRRDLAV